MIVILRIPLVAVRIAFCEMIRLDRLIVLVGNVVVAVHAQIGVIGQIV